jgi:2-(1,2-epoxy-1,2-dihydrophenyl)acetyl-CoA isomerase
VLDDRLAEVLRVDLTDHVATLTLDRPHRRNAMDATLGEAMLVATEALSTRDDVRAIVLTGAGEHFCADGDIADGAGGIASDAPLPTIVRDLRTAMRSSQLLHEMPIPSVAVVRGACAGAGLSWAAACDLRICSDTARFSTAFVRAGVSGDFGGTWTLPRIVGDARARELYLLSERFGADEALAMGLVSRVVPDADLDEAGRSVARRLASLPPLAVAGAKANLNDAAHTTFRDHLDVEATRHAGCARTQDAVEAAMSFLEKREPTFHGR